MARRTSLLDPTVVLVSSLAAMIALAVCYCYSLRTVRLFKKSVTARA